MVIWAETAKNHLRDIHDYLIKESPSYARYVISSIVKKTRYLAKFPHLGRIFPDLANKDIREIFVFSYRIIYQASPDKIMIFSIIHMSRDLSPEAVLKNVPKDH